MADAPFTAAASRTVPFYGCAAEYAELAPQIQTRTAEVLGGGKVLQGPEVSRFETRIAATAGRRHCVAVGSGTDALFFALKALDIGPGDEVLVPDVTFLASATAVLRTGARPVFVDIDRACNVDLGKAASQLTPRTRAMVFVQLFGGMSDPDRVEAFAKSHGLLLVEDFAQSFGARYGDRPSGSLGLAGAVSFDPTKVIGAPGSGGAVVTDDDELAARIRRLRLHGKEGGAFVELGYNSQLPSWTAAILDLKLDRHQDWTARRRMVAKTYLSSFADLPIEMPDRDAAVSHVWHKFVLRTKSRDRLIDHLHRAGIPTMIHYARPLHREPIFGCTQPDSLFPCATSHALRALSLPIHAHLSDGEVEQVTDAVRRFFG